MDKLFEFHCHTSHSRDGGAKIEDIIKLCSDRRVTGIAITDHDQIGGALALRKTAPNWLTVVIGEEINTAQGEVIGIYLNKKIDSGLSLKETILKIKEQGGLVALPHPFDRLRSKKIPLEEIKKNIDQIDIIETFNARSIFSNDNKKAQEFALANNKPQIPGSDAHFIGEYGKTLIKGTNCAGSNEFLESLKKSVFIEHKTSILYHFMTKCRKINGN